jgi:GntR family transcriptional regulator
MSGDLLPGVQLPTTTELMERYHTTNPTVQKALKVLKDEGFLVGRSGVGVFVRSDLPLTIHPIAYFPPADPGEPYPWISQALNRGQTGSSRLLAVETQRPPAAVCQALDLGQQGQAVLRRQLLTLNDSPAELAEIYFPAELADGTELAQKKKIRGGSPRILEGLNVKVCEWVDRISTRLPTTEELELLELPSDIPVLRTFRVGYATDRRPVQVEVLVKGGNLYELQYSRIA